MLGFVQTALMYVVPFLFVLTLVVTIHELGHFLVARAFGTAVDRFSIGFGRAILKWTDHSGVEWRIGWIPFGGYVRFSGDENAASVPDSNDLDALHRAVVATEGAEALKRYFHFKPLYQRALVVVAGPVANFILAIALFAGLLMTVGEVVLPPAKVATVVEGSAAQRAGFRPGDVILEADGREVRDFRQLQQRAQLRGGMPVKFIVDRGGDQIVLTATPVRQIVQVELGGPQRLGVLGLTSVPGQAKVVRYGPIEAIQGGAAKTWDVLDTTLFYLGRMIRGEEAADKIGGPIGIVKAAGDVAAMGAKGAPDFATQVMGAVVTLLGLAAVLSVSLGFLNLLPVPVLDGGHLLFYAYEAVARRPLPGAAQAAGFRVGLALVLGLMLFATWNDLQNLRVFQFLGGLRS